MLRLPRFILVLACLSFLTTQISGAHLHAEGGVLDGMESHGLHLQNAFGHEHDHIRAHVDVSVLELASADTMDKFTIASALPMHAVPRANESAWPDVTSSLFLNHHSRWGPPARAPPSPI